MKNKSILFLAFIALALFTSSSCKKTTDSNDLTTSIIGNYTNAAEATNIVVNKVDNSTVSITLVTGTGSGKYDVAFPNVTMNSANAFNLNSVTQNGGTCIGTEIFSGTGTTSNNSISLFITVIGTGTGTPYDCSNWTDNVSASK